MTPLTHLMRNNSQVGLNACRANGETVGNACMYINDICNVYDVFMMCHSSPALLIPSTNPQVHLPREKNLLLCARGRTACA